MTYARDMSLFRLFFRINSLNTIAYMPRIAEEGARRIKAFAGNLRNGSVQSHLPAYLVAFAGKSNGSRHQYAATNTQHTCFPPAHLQTTLQKGLRRFLQRHAEGHRVHRRQGRGDADRRLGPAACGRTVGVVCLPKPDPDPGDPASAGRRVNEPAQVGPPRIKRGTLYPAHFPQHPDRSEACSCHHRQHCRLLPASGGQLYDQVCHRAYR